MKSFKLTLAICALSFFVNACDNASRSDQRATNDTPPGAANTPAPAHEASATPDELAAARATYAQFCIRCHRPDGTGGDFELEDGKKLKVPSLREHGHKESDEHLADQIINGGDGMPAFKGRLDQERIDALVRFVRREFHGQGASGAHASATPAH